MHKKLTLGSAQGIIFLKGCKYNFVLGISSWQRFIIVQNYKLNILWSHIAFITQLLWVVFKSNFFLEKSSVMYTIFQKQTNKKPRNNRIHFPLFNSVEVRFYQESCSNYLRSTFPLSIWGKYHLLPLINEICM